MMKEEEIEIKQNKFLRLPVVSLSAEYLVMGHLMRRNILAYKAPPNNEGYDLICIHPDPKKVTKQIRVQVKSRYQTDCSRGFPIKAKTIECFDFLIVVFLNIGFYYWKQKKGENARIGRQEPEFYTLTPEFIRKYHTVNGGWEKVRLRNLEEDLELYKNEQGFGLIAQILGIEYPTKLK